MDGCGLLGQVRTVGLRRGQRVRAARSRAKSFRAPSPSRTGGFRESASGASPVVYLSWQSAEPAPTGVAGRAQRWRGDQSVAQQAFSQRDLTANSLANAEPALDQCWSTLLLSSWFGVALVQDGPGPPPDINSSQGPE